MVKHTFNMEVSLHHGIFMKQMTASYSHIISTFSLILSYDVKNLDKYKTVLFFKRYDNLS